MHLEGGRIQSLFCVFPSNFFAFRSLRTGAVLRKLFFHSDSVASMESIRSGQLPGPTGDAET